MEGRMKSEERVWTGDGGVIEVPHADLPDCCGRHAIAYGEYVFFECASCGALWDEVRGPSGRERQMDLTPMIDSLPETTLAEAMLEIVEGEEDR